MRMSACEWVRWGTRGSVMQMASTLRKPRQAHLKRDERILEQSQIDAGVGQHTWQATMPKHGSKHVTKKDRRSYRCVQHVLDKKGIRCGLQERMLQRIFPATKINAQQKKRKEGRELMEMRKQKVRALHRHHMIK